MQGITLKPDLFGERMKVQGALRRVHHEVIPLGGKPPSGWSSATYHEDRRAFEHSATPAIYPRSQ